MNAVPVQQVGVASGVNNTVSRIASLLAIAVLGLVMLNRFNHSLNQRLPSLQLSLAAQQFLVAQRVNLAAVMPPGLSAATTAALKSAIAATFVDGFRLVMGIAVGLAIASVVAAGWLLERRAVPARTPADWRG